MEDLLAAIVAELAEQEGISDHALGKRLGLGMSQLNRALSLLCLDAAAGGLGLVEARQDERRRTLWLTDKGRTLCRPN
ncbi:MAG: hypothetical protein JO218_16020 [Burkholderiales bacterium]|nr:hypothetical protein [Burkholderiales bacterium]